MLHELQPPPEAFLVLFYHGRQQYQERAQITKLAGKYKQSTRQA